MNDNDSIQRAHAAALRFLSHRPRSVAEVRTRLLGRFSHGVVEQALEDLMRQGLIDDSRFAQLWTENRDTHRPRSAAAIKRELSQKGVPRDVAEAAVAGVDDHESAYRAGARRARQLDGSDHATFQRRLWGYLQRRGYSSSVTRRAVEKLWDDTRPGERRQADAEPAE